MTPHFPSDSLTPRVGYPFFYKGEENNSSNEKDFAFFPEPFAPGMEGQPLVLLQGTLASTWNADVAKLKSTFTCSNLVFDDQSEVGKSQVMRKGMYYYLDNFELDT